jgi:hypothetical protein
MRGGQERRGGDQPPRTGEADPERSASGTTSDPGAGWAARFQCHPIKGDFQRKSGQRRHLRASNTSRASWS